MVRWGDKEKKALRELSEIHANKDVAAIFGIKESTIKRTLNRLGICRSVEAQERLSVHKREGIVKSNSKRVGDKNPVWKGGISSNNYHYKKIQIARYPERVNARRILNEEVRAGRIKRGPCVICGVLRTQGHHEDYQKPLSVIWLCRMHHREEHGDI
jgi:DNA-binding CsgD family transcriptional regulator